MPENFGVWTTAQLLGAGFSKNDLRKRVHDGSLRRLRQGWLAELTANAHVVRAVSAGGVASCVTALRLHGVWVPEGLGDVHVRLPGRPTGPRSRCQPYGGNSPIMGSVDALDVAVSAAAKCVDAESCVVLLDSLLHVRLATQEQLERMLQGAPRHVRNLLAKVDRAEAGTESMVRLRLRARGVRVRTQVQVTRDHRVDLLVGDRLIIECDSKAHHSSWEQQRRDRQRDRELLALGYLVIRLTYEQVCYSWAAAEADILAVIRAGRHRWPRRRLK